MLIKLLINLLIIINQISHLFGDATESKPLSLKDTYKLCDRIEFKCIGINSRSKFVGDKLDCTNSKNRDCVAFLLINHLKKRNLFNFYLISNDKRISLMKLNLFHGTRVSIELNCTDFINHKPIVQMNIEDYRLPFKTIPNFEQPKDILNLGELKERYCIWSSEENFFINNIFKNEASYLYFDFLKRNYDIHFHLRRTSDDNFQAKRLSAIQFVKLNVSSYHYIELIFSINIICLVTLLLAIFLQKG